MTQQITEGWHDWWDYKSDDCRLMQTNIALQDPRVRGLLVRRFYRDVRDHGLGGIYAQRRRS